MLPHGVEELVGLEIERVLLMWATVDVAVIGPASADDQNVPGHLAGFVVMSQHGESLASLSGNELSGANGEDVFEVLRRIVHANL
jgi:hypothetical protein